MFRTLIALICVTLTASGTSRAADVPDTNAPAAEDARDRVFYSGDTEHVKPLARKFAVNVLLDQKDIWTSPFRMNGNTAKWWLVMGAATAALIATDDHTINTFENAPTQVRWGNNISSIGAVYTVVPVVVGFYVAGAIVDDPKARETGVLGAEALVDGLILQEVLKPIAGRERPNVAHQHQKWFNGGASFPSGHAIESWALASIVAHEYSHRKWVPFVAYGLATVVGTARFTAQQHYASDVFAGAAMGWFVGRYVFETHRYHANHVHGLHPHISPLLQPAAGTYGLALTLGK
jgi:membrane-associated phospholipid phosphatase